MEAMKVFEQLSMEVVFGGHVHRFCKESATVEEAAQGALCYFDPLRGCKVCSHDAYGAKGLTLPGRVNWPRNRRFPRPECKAE